MNTTTLIFVIVGALAIIFALIWRFRIRTSKKRDPDFDRNAEAKERAES